MSKKNPHPPMSPPPMAPPPYVPTVGVRPASPFTPEESCNVSFFVILKQFRIKTINYFFQSKIIL